MRWSMPGVSGVPSAVGCRNSVAVRAGRDATIDLGAVDISGLGSTFPLASCPFSSLFFETTNPLISKPHFGANKLPQTANFLGAGAIAEFKNRQPVVACGYEILGQRNIEGTQTA